MKVWHIAALSAGLIQLTACGGSSWVHPAKHQDEFAGDYNRCESEVIKDPKLQQGNRYLTLQATERCVMKKGWTLRETDN